MLLLRVTAGAAAVAQAGSFFVNGTAVTPYVALAGLAVLSGVGLVAGCLTPAAAMGVAISTLAIAAASATPAGASLSTQWQGAAVIAADAFALAMLGPGAYSIDAWQFGRREIIIPDVPRPGSRS